MESKFVISKIGRKFISPRETPNPIRPLTFGDSEVSSCLLAIREISPHSAIGVIRIYIITPIIRPPMNCQK